MEEPFRTATAGGDDNDEKLKLTQQKSSSNASKVEEMANGDVELRYLGLYSCGWPTGAIWSVT
jgi:hypothetical protein